MGNPALNATAIRYGLNPAAASSMSDDQLRKFISLRQARKAKPKPRPKPPKAKPKPKAVKPKPSRGGSVFPGIGPTVKFGPGGKPRIVGAGPIEQAVEAGRPENRRLRDRQRRETIRRQQLLRSAGYGVVVDGTWGPRSQAAWNKFKRHAPVPILVNKAGSALTLPFSDPRAEAKRRQQLFQAQAEREQQQAERQKGINDRRAAHAAEVQMASQRATIIRQARVLRDNPRIAAKMTLKQLTSVLTDKETGFDLATSQAAARAVQYHLNAHGYNVKVDGRFGQQTYNALKSAFRDQDRRERKKRLRTIRQSVYLPLDLEPGEKLKGFPLDKVPTVSELDVLLQKGGPQARAVMRYLDTHAFTPAAAFDAARWRQLEFIAGKRRPGFEKLHEKDPATRAEILAALRAPFDYVGAEARGKMASEDAKFAQYKGQTVWDSQLRAILRAKNPDQMKRMFLAYDAVNEQKFKRKQAELAKHKGFWGEAFDKLLAPGEWTFTAGTVATMRAIQEGSRLTGRDAGERDVRWEDAQIILGYAKPGDFPGYDHLAKKASGWLTIPGSLIIDPLNFATPFKAASTLARFGRGTSSLGKYNVKGFVLEGQALVYEKGIWSKAELARKIPGASTLEATKSGQAAVAFGKKLVDDKDKVLSVVRGRVSQAARHGFAPVNNFARKQIKVKAPTNIAEIQAAKVAVRSWIEDPRNPELKGLIQELRETKASLYVDAPRSTMSNVGASVLANWGEKARVLAAHQFGTDEALRLIEQHDYEGLRRRTNEAWEHWKQAKAKADDATLSAQERRHWRIQARERVKPAVALNEERKRVQQEIVDSYAQVVDDAGVYIKGGALKADGHLYAKEILNRTLMKMDAMEDAILPTIQDMLEDFADEAFQLAKAGQPLDVAARGVDEVTGLRLAPEEVVHPMWDEEGLWLARNSEEAEALRARSRRAFDEENMADVPNPAHDVAHTRNEMGEAIQFEIKRSLPRIFNYAHREAMRLGKEFTFDAEAAAFDLEREIWRSWEQRADGLWYDKRPTIKVNRLYARNFKAVADSFADDLKSYLDDDGIIDLPGLEEIAAHGPTGAVDGFDDSANSLLWQLGSRFKTTPGLEMKLGEETTRVRHGPRAPEGLNQRQSQAWYRDEYARLSEFSTAVARYRVALSEGADEVLPSELSKNLLFMRALAVHQAKWAKGVYLTLNGFLKIWKFATLPLRPGWVVRNTVDNFAKAMVAAVRDPRMLLLGAEDPKLFMKAGYATRSTFDAVHTVFDLGVTPLRGAIRFFDGLFNTKALDEFDKLLETFWNFPSEIITKFFDLSALPAPPQAVLDSSRFSRQLDDWRTGSRSPVNITLGDYQKAQIQPPLRLQKVSDKRAYEQMMLYGNPTAAQRLAYKMRKTPDALWDLMANRPENYFKRVIYRSVLKRERDRLIAGGEHLTPAIPAGRPVLDLMDEQALQRLWEGATGADKALFKKAFDDWIFQGEWNYTAELGDAIRRAGFEVPPAQHFQHDLSVHPMTARFVFDDYGLPQSGGTPGLKSFQTENEYALTYTADDGKPAGVVVVDRRAGGGGGLVVYVEPEYRRQGIATKMYERAMEEGIDVEALSGAGPMTPFGAQFFAGRRSKQAAAQAVPEKLDEITIEMLAHEKAWDAVVETLFDYSKLSVIEDNLRVFMPFIQFWRKNTRFWVQTGVNKPWLPLSVLKLDQQRRMAHEDLAEWMQRYLHVNEFVDAAGVVPGLDTLVQMILPNEQMTDPTSFLSFAPIHRVFRDLVYGDNPFLPEEDRAHGAAGMIIAPLVRAMDEWGLGLNPIVRKPMEVAGLIDARNWQAVFPQTSLAEAFTLKFWGEDAMFRVAQWERVFTLGNDVHAEQLVKNYEIYVNREMVQQQMRGEPMNRSTAEATVKATIWTQQLWAYFGGTYWRSATPEDIYIAKLQDDLRKGQIDFDDLSDEQKEVLALWSRAKGGAESFDRYLKMLGQIQAFYQEPDFNERSEMLKTYPALAEYVDLKPIVKTVGKNWVKNVQRHTDAARYFMAVGFTEDVDAAHDVKAVAYDTFATPELKAFWKTHSTPTKLRDRMIKGEIFRDMKALQDAYFKIPETDFEARDGFLKEHPELPRWWTKHNDPSDNYEAIMGAVKADLRDFYFKIVESQGFAAAAPILKQFPFMFEGTKSEKKIRDGEWIVGYGRRGWNSARRQAWMQVAGFARWFFDSYMEKVGSDKAFDWLRAQSATNPQAKALLDYFARYGKGSSGGGRSANWSSDRRAHWAKVANFARWFFDFYLPKVGEDKAWAWLRKQQGVEARQFMAYIDRYSTKEGGGKFSSERRAAYLEVKGFMSWFFDSYLPKVGEKRAWAWLRSSNDPQAQAMVQYLAKYGKHSQKSVDYRKAKHWLGIYFDLPEDQRQAWLNGSSEGAKTVRWYFDKYAHQSDMTQHGKDYRAAKGDLKAYFDLPKEQRTAWLNSGSPQAQRVLAYFKKYGKAHQYEREFKKLVQSYPVLSHGTPEQARRLQFWKTYFSLTPEKRPAFVLKNAEDYGVFIYGDLSETVRHDQEAEYDRRAVGLGMSQRAADFLYVRPLLSYYQTLGKKDKQLFLKANPELQDYFDKYSTYSPTGDKKLDLMIERYFLMPENSPLRSEMLKKHPELQDYFDAKSSPALRAMRAVLEQYFTIKNPNQRKEFLLLHPEIRDYFDARKAEREETARQLAAFEQADPRLRPYFKDNQDMRRSADMMARKLHHAAISSLEETTRTLQLRRERRPAA